MQIESFTTPPLQTCIPSYLYWEYSADPTLQSFVDAYNSLSQGYLNWFINTPLSVYTNPNIGGALLDWIANGIYGISRPIISTAARSTTGAWNTKPFDKIPFDSQLIVSSGSAQAAN